MFFILSKTIICSGAASICVGLIVFEPLVSLILASGGGMKRAESATVLCTVPVNGTKTEDTGIFFGRRNRCRTKGIVCVLCAALTANLTHAFGDALSVCEVPLRNPFRDGWHIYCRATRAVPDPVAGAGTASLACCGCGSRCFRAAAGEKVPQKGLLPLMAMVH
jgi:hypothetical protein